MKSKLLTASIATALVGGIGLGVAHHYAPQPVTTSFPTIQVVESRDPAPNEFDQRMALVTKEHESEHERMLVCNARSTTTWLHAEWDTVTGLMKKPGECIKLHGTVSAQAHSRRYVETEADEAQYQKVHAAIEAQVAARMALLDRGREHDVTYWPGHSPYVYPKGVVAYANR